MLAKIAMQASYLYDETTKAFNDGDGNYSLSSAVAQCKAKKDFFEVRVLNKHLKNGFCAFVL